jgi:hypothetical protein
MKLPDLKTRSRDAIQKCIANMPDDPLSMAWDSYGTYGTRQLLVKPVVRFRWRP